MDPGRYDTRINRGSIWEFTFTWKAQNGTPKDLTGYSAVAEFKQDGADWNTALMATASPSLTNDGKIHVKLEEPTTDAIVWDEGQWRLVIIEVDTDRYPLLTGLATVR